MKKYFVVILAVLLMNVFAAGLIGFAEGTADFEYTILDDGTAEITAYNGLKTDIIIPGEIDGYVVTSIGHRVFQGCSHLISVNMPEGLMHIGESAFEGCTGLMQIAIPDSVTDIDSCAFSHCANITEINLPKNLKSMGGNPFMLCDKLTSIMIDSENTCFEVIDGVLFNKLEKKLISYPYGFTMDHYTVPEGTLAIGEHAFQNCDSLKTITIPEGVESIGEDCFFLASSLQTINIPYSMVSIDGNPFAGTILNTIDISQDHEYFKVIDGVLFSKNDNKLICYPKGSTIENYSVPDGVSEIGDNAFFLNNKIERIEIPSSVTTIGSYSFYGCVALKEVYVPASVTNFGIYEPFEYCDNLTLTVVMGSYAEKYAMEHNLQYIAIEEPAEE